MYKIQHYSFHLKISRPVAHSPKNVEWRGIKEVTEVYLYTKQSNS